ncbi:MAG: tol-pal system YbgF family protein [Planctomycetota bacterium]
MSALASLLLAAALLPQGPDGGFSARRVATAAGGERTVVTADRRAVACLDALQQLATTMDWNVRVDGKPLESDLRFCTVDLDLVDQDPRIIGQLLAVSAGADTVFDAGDRAAGMRPTLHVTRKPSAQTESGRNRLRELAGQWYRSFLVDELRHEPLVAKEAMQVRMHLGHLLVENGDLEAAIPFFREVYDERPGVLVPAALLRLASTHNELAAQVRDPAAARAHYEKAEQWCRKLLDTQPSSPEATGATVALGRALLGQAAVADDPQRARDLCDQCRVELAARVMRLFDTVEMLDVWLLVGEAQFRLEWPTRVYETMLTLRESPNFGDLDDRQFRDYHFLLGYGALGSDKPELAMKSLEWFLIHAESDERRGLANVLLADAYLRQDRFVEARAAAVAARRHFMAGLQPRWRTQALRLWARTALALGDKESAFQELEVLVHREDDPELVLFLVDELIADRQWQRAISVARILHSRQGQSGDLARFKSVVALFEQAEAGGSLAEFPPLARELAPRIADADLRARCAEMIGDAFTKLGQLEAAADAYRGILR